MTRPIAPRWLTALCYVAMMALAIGLNLLPIFLTTLETAYGDLNKEQLGRLGACSFTGVVLGILATGPAADRWGAKPFALGGGAFLAVGLIASAFAPTYTTLCIALFVLGLGAGVLDMVLSPVVAALNPLHRTVAMNWLHSFYCVGAVVTILLGTLVLKSGYGWRTACLALLPLPLVLTFLFASQPFPPVRAEAGGTPVRRLIGKPWFVLALAALFFGGATELGMAQWLPAYAETALNFPAWIGGGALLMFSLAMAAGRMVIGLFGEKTDPFIIMSWSCGLSIVCFLLGSYLPVPSLALAACILAGFTGSCLWPTMLAVTADRYPAGGASMFGILAAFGNAGGIVMPWVVGWMADLRDLHAGLALSALAPAVMWIILKRMTALSAQMR